MLPTYKYVLALDPSGNYNEGKGTTGMCLFDTSLMKTTFITDLRAKILIVLKVTGMASFNLF